MSDKIKTELRNIDWMKVRLLSLSGKVIHIGTEEGPVVFEFATEAEAKAAIEEWFIQNGAKN